MGIFDRFKNKSTTVTRFEMVTDKGNGYYSWNGNLYKSDIVRAAIRPKVKAIGKLTAKHIRETVNIDGTLSSKVNPDAYMRFLLEEPNPYMTGQMLQEKVTTQLQLNNNAFIYINRDDLGYPNELYPIPCMSAEAIYNAQGELFLKMTMRNGKMITYPYTDIIHLRQDYNENDIFGDSPRDALLPLMEIVTTTDQGIIKAIKNSNVVKWLLKFNQTLRPEDIKKQTDEFVNTYLNIDSDSGGAAATDAKMDAIRVDPKDYVPNAEQLDRTTQRIYSFFGTNDDIVQSKWDENKWLAYYESELEPFAIQMSGEYSRKLFTRRERAFGNSIIFESANLAFASMQTKLALVQYVDRAVMSANELRKILNLPPVEGGDVYVRRLDTAAIDKNGQ